MSSRTRSLQPILLLLASGLLSCRGEERVAVADGVRERVKTIPIRGEMIVPEIRSFGTIAYFSKVEVTASTEGVIRTIEAEEGDWLRKGQLIATVENLQLEIRKRQILAEKASAESALELASARLWEGGLQVQARLMSVRRGEIELRRKGLELENARKTVENKQKLFTVGGIPEETMDAFRMQLLNAESDFQTLAQDLEIKRIGLRDEDIASLGQKAPENDAARAELLVWINTQALRAEEKVARSRLASAQAELESIDQLLEETAIRAPISGLVGARHLEQGERVAPGAGIVTLFNLSRVFALFSIPEDDALNVAEGMEVEVTVDALKGKSRMGKIHLISTVIDPKTGNLAVKAILENPGMLLKPGMFIRVRVITGEPRETVLIPKTAVGRAKGRKGAVFTVVRGRALLKEVSLGAEREGRIEVLDGLSAGELLIDSPSPALSEGEEVDAQD